MTYHHRFIAQYESQGRSSARLFTRPIRQSGHSDPLINDHPTSQQKIPGQTVSRKLHTVPHPRIYLSRVRVGALRCVNPPVEQTTRGSSIESIPRKKLSAPIVCHPVLLVFFSCFLRFFVYTFSLLDSIRHIRDAWPRPRAKTSV